MQARYVRFDETKLKRLVETPEPWKHTHAPYH